MRIKLYLCSLSLLCTFIFSCKKSTPLPDEHDKTLCEQIGDLEGNIEFNNKLNFLYDSSQKFNYEDGFLMYSNSQNSYNYEYIKGELNSPSLSITLTDKTDGVIHSHYNSLHPIFSVGDMKALYEIVDGQYIRNPKTFSFGVVSAKGVSYLIKFADYSKAVTFLNENFKNSTNILAIEKQYKTALDLNLKKMSTVTAGEVSFLSIFGLNGMTLLRANKTNNKWVRIELDSSNRLVEVTCG